MHHCSRAPRPPARLPHGRAPAAVPRGQPAHVPPAAPAAPRAPRSLRAAPPPGRPGRPRRRLARASVCCQCPGLRPPSRLARPRSQRAQPRLRPRAAAPARRATPQRLQGRRPPSAAGRGAAQRSGRRAGPASRHRAAAPGASPRGRPLSPPHSRPSAGVPWTTGTAAVHAAGVRAGARCPTALQAAGRTAACGERPCTACLRTGLSCCSQCGLVVQARVAGSPATACAPGSQLW